mmetsp:Transcript_18887/g.38436  ORF Transcript_18887/g.38436 Transcript_18887/m.38436 type:complete len:392 (+) Transcript_18887:608-1783(+)
MVGYQPCQSTGTCNRPPRHGCRHTHQQETVRADRHNTIHMHNTTRTHAAQTQPQVEHDKSNAVDGAKPSLDAAGSRCASNPMRVHRIWMAATAASNTLKTWDDKFTSLLLALPHASALLWLLLLLAFVLLVVLWISGRGHLCLLHDGRDEWLLHLRYLLLLHLAVRLHLLVVLKTHRDDLTLLRCCVLLNRIVLGEHRRERAELILVVPVILIEIHILLVREAIHLVLLGHIPKGLARVPFKPIPRDPDCCHLVRRGGVGLAESPPVLIAGRRTNDPARHVIVRVDRVKEMSVAAVHGVVHIVRPPIAHRVRAGELPVPVKVVVLEAPLDSLAHQIAMHILHFVSRPRRDRHPPFAVLVQVVMVVIVQVVREHCGGSLVFRVLGVCSGLRG